MISTFIHTYFFLQGINFLNLHKSDATENDLNSIICKVPNVVHLDLSCTSCSDETLFFIEKMCSHVLNLNVSYCDDVTDKGIQNLCSREKLLLRSLNILGTGVEFFGIATILDSMPSLECLKYDDLTGTLYEIGGRAAPYNLTDLVYDDSLDGDNAKVMRDLSKKYPKLKKIHFEFPVDKKVLQACTKFEDLEELKIKMSHSYSGDLRSYDVLVPILPLSKKLKILILSCLEIPILTLVECFTNLEQLYLKNVSFKQFTVEDIECSETKLCTLVIKDANMEISGPTYKALILLISLSKNVTELHFSHIRDLPHEIFDIIANSMKNLAVVKFKYTYVEMESLIPLFDIPSMKMLHVNQWNRVDATIPNFSEGLFSTLSWREMFGPDEEEEMDENDYCYGEDSSESDIISEQCNSSDSYDDVYWRYAFGYGTDDDHYGFENVLNYGYHDHDWY